MAGRRRFWLIWLIALGLGGLSLVLLWHWVGSESSGGGRDLDHFTLRRRRLPVHHFCPSGCDFDSVQAAVDASRSKTRSGWRRLSTPISARGLG
jgi:hypothetical protein